MKTLTKISIFLTLLIMLAVLWPQTASLNIFVPRNYFYSISPVQPQVGIITTIAGNMSSNNNFNVDGELAKNVALNFPRDVATDSEGNIYIADTVNYRVRRVDKKGKVTTFAGNGSPGFSGDGGPARAASLNSPQGIAVDKDGNAYIADTVNHRIRQVNKKGNITTFAGNGRAEFSGDGGTARAASLNTPQGVAVDDRGNVYIVDTNNNRIRMVNAATNVISTVAGNSTKGFSGDEGLATKASLNQPLGVTIDVERNIYIADTGNSRIRRVDRATNVISTVAGNGIKGFSGDEGLATAAALSEPFGVAIDTEGNIYIADTRNNRIRQLNKKRVITTVVGTGMPEFNGDEGAPKNINLASPVGIAIDISGNLLVTDNGNHRIRMVDAVTKNIKTIAGNGIRNFNGDGELATNAFVPNPPGLAIDAENNIYISDIENHRIRMVDAITKNIKTIAGNGIRNFGGEGSLATNTTLFAPIAVAVDVEGNVYIADAGNYRVRKIDKATGIITTIVGNKVGFDGDGKPADTNTKLDFPRGVALDTRGNIYITDAGNHRIRKIDKATNIITTVAGSGPTGQQNGSFGGDGGLATNATLNSPVAIAIDTDDNIYIADSKNNRIRKVDAVTGIIITIAGGEIKGFKGDEGLAKDAALDNPQGIAVDKDGDVYIADADNNRIRKIDKATNIIRTIAGDGVKGFGGDDGPATKASLQYPQAIVIDKENNIYIADTRNNRIRKIVGKPTLAQDFTLNINPLSQIVSAGTTTSFNISLQSINGFSSSVSLAAELEQSNSGISFKFSPSSINPSQSSTLSVSTAPNLLPGTYSITVKATFGALVKTFRTTLNVSSNQQDFQLSVRNDLSNTTEPQKITAGTTAKYIVTAQPLAGFDGTINLSASLEPSNENIIFDFSPSTITPQQSSRFSIITKPDLKPNTYSILVTGTSGGSLRTESIILIVVSSSGGFSLSTDLPSIDYKLGDPSPEIKIITEAIGNFSADINLSTKVDPKPDHINLTIVSSTISPGQSTTLIVNIGPSTPIGNYSIFIEGKSGPQSILTKVFISIKEPDFSLEFPEPRKTVQAGKASKFVVFVKRAPSFSKVVTVSLDQKSRDILMQNKIILKDPFFQTTTETSTELSFEFKVKRKATLGDKSIVFIASDGSSRLPRVNTLTLTVTTPK